MRRRWNWDFEDEPRPGQLRGSAPLAAARVARRMQVRRRRGGAILALVGVLAVVAAATSGSSGRRSSSIPAGQAGTPRVALTPAAPPKDSEADRNSAVAAVMGYTPFVREGGADGRDVALTFDDGPGPYTPALLSVLEQFRVPGTFFAIGSMERYFSASTMRELRDGDVVGDHTETHPQMALLSAHDQHEQLFDQIARIELLGGPRPQLFRPPYGSYSPTTIRELRALHLLMVLWSIDTSDYRQPGVAAIVKRVLAGARPGAIILMHDGGGNRSETIAALPPIIRALRARGLHLVTVPQLLLDAPPARGEPLPASLNGD
jgi:peptidoglycan/xylan/chitin deacetylase (PgdA/CDA1 family)